MNSQATQTASSLQAAAAQTIAAQQLEASVSAMGQFAQATSAASNANATMMALSANATVTAMCLQATAMAGEAQATAASQVLQATWMAQSAQATAVSQAATASAQAYRPPTQLPPSPEVVERLNFASGATSTYVDGMINEGQTLNFLLRALAGQTMMVSVYSPGYNVYLGIVGLSDGIPLMRTAVEGTEFSGVLAMTQDYQISLFSPDQRSSYTLQVIIPARIQFAPGAISANVDGRVIGGSTNHYLLRANAGQTMSITIFSPKDDLFLTIYGMTDGNPLVRSVSGATSWSGILPGTQDYSIQVVSTGDTSNYTLQVIVQ
jgi:hypothetical protein